MTPMPTDPVAAAVARVRDWLEGENTLHPDDVRDLFASYQSVREDAARLDWLSSTLESAVGGGVEVNDDRLVYLEPEKGKEVRVFWYPETPVGFTQFFGSTIREAIDRARTGGTE